MRSISAGSAPATAQAIACRTMRSYRRSRSGAGTVFESHTPGMWRSGCSTTAAATTGPARHPRPTSSQPATCTNPTRRSAFSSVRVAETRVIQVRWVGWGRLVGRVRRGWRQHPPGLPDSPDLCTLAALRLGGVLHPRRLALEIAQVVELGAPDLGRAGDLHFCNRRRMQREDALDSLPERDLPHGEG